MNILFIDGFCDYKFLKENNRINNVNNVLVLFASMLKCNSHKVSIVDAREKFFSKQFLDVLIAKELYNVIIWAANHDNIKNINEWYRKHSNITSIVITQNFDYRNLFFFNSTLLQFVYDEKKDLEYNVKAFFNLLSIPYNVDNNFYDYLLYPSITKKTININIGWGCPRLCSFCPISNTLPYYRPIRDVIIEIRSILNKGVNFFHIANHSFFANPIYVKELCQQLINEFDTFDYGWSCFMVPEFMENNLDLLPLLKKAKLLKIEIGAERIEGNSEENFNISYSSNSLFEIIKELSNLDIPSISINYIIDVSRDSYIYLEELREHIFTILNVMQGCCDINFYRFYNLVSNNIVNHKYDFGGPIEDFSHIIKWQTSIQQDIYEFRKKTFYKLSLKKLYQHSDLINYTIQTQLWVDIIRQTFFQVLYNNRKHSDCLYFSWEITDKIEDYAPILYGRAHYKGGKRYITIPHYYSPNNEVQLLEIDPYIYHLIKSTLTIKEIIEYVAHSSHYDPKMIKDQILKVLQKLENLHMVLYTKILN